MCLLYKRLLFIEYVFPKVLYNLEGAIIVAPLTISTVLYCTSTASYRRTKHFTSAHVDADNKRIPHLFIQKTFSEICKVPTHHKIMRRHFTDLERGSVQGLTVLLSF